MDLRGMIPKSPKHPRNYYYTDEELEEITEKMEHPKHRWLCDEEDEDYDPYDMPLIGDIIYIIVYLAPLAFFIYCFIVGIE